MSGALTGKVALVTGASRGIGREIALTLAAEGADVGLVSTSLEGTRTLVQELERLGRRCAAVAADVGDARAVDAALEVVRGRLGELDVLVNNAGIVKRLPLEQMEDTDFDDVLRVNLSGAFYFCRRVLPHMAERGHGRIINISSISGTLGSSGMSGYCASKWGLNGLTQSLAEEYKARGVFVAAVLPSGVATEMLVGSQFPSRVGTDEVARVVRFLAAEAPFAMTGSLVEVYG